MNHAGKILICCHANRCRSPIGEALLVEELSEGGKSQIAVSSAGFLQSGVPAEPEVVAVLQEIGLDASAHASTQITKQLIDEADLILMMERAQVRQIAVDYRCFPKVFTVKEFARRAQQNPGLRDEPLSNWVGRVHNGRTTADLKGSDAADEVADPIGQGVAAFRATRDELSASIKEIVSAMP